MSAIEVDRLDMRYGDVVAVQGLSFVAGAGAVTCVLGRNGAGKTSTIEALEGLRRPDGGRLSVLGFDPQRDHAALVLRVGVMLQEVGLPPSVRVGEIARCTADLYPASVNVPELLERLDLTRLERRTIRQLSGGEQRRLALALALVGRPQVAFLDEPTAGVDADGREVIREIIGELRDDGVAVLLTTHDLTEAERVADQFVVIDAGQLRAEGTLDELRSRGGGEPEIRFRAPSGLDTAGLAEHLGGWHHAPVTEIAWGEYRVAAQPVPGLIAALTSWLDYYGLPLADLRTGHQTLEDLFMELTTPVDGPPELLPDGAGYPPTVAAQPARRPRPSTGEHPLPSGYPTTGGFPTTDGYPAVDDQPALHDWPEHPVADDHPVPVAKRFADGYPVAGGFPTTGGYPAVDGQPAGPDRPATGEYPVTGGQPLGQRRSGTGEHPLAGRGRPTTGEYPVAGGQQRQQGRAATGEHPNAGGPSSGRGRPTTGKYPVNGGPPGGRGWPASGEHPIAGGQPPGRERPATGVPPMADRRRLSGEHPIGGNQPMGRGRPATGERQVAGGQPAGRGRNVGGENPVAGGHSAGGGRTAGGERPVAGGQAGGRGRPTSGERPVAGGQPAGRGRGRAGMGRRRRKGGAPPGVVAEPLPEPTPPPARYPNVVFRD